ncbi:MAG: hypothetical protein KME38_09000 [Spirirestis rafaelensis WJT71-NPBG6]|nr:hypothetical protein [Spirirestis rafaelensis WJT71-NPBG6]
MTEIMVRLASMLDHPPTKSNDSRIFSPFFYLLAKLGCSHLNFVLTQVAGYRNSVASRSSDSCDRQLQIGGWAMPNRNFKPITSTCTQLI